MSSRQIVFISIVVASLFWATAATVGKILLRNFEPFPLAFWRFVFASLIIVPILLNQKKINWGNLLKNVVPVAVFSTANVALFYFGLKKTTANAAAIIYTAVPLVTAIFAKLFINEQLNVRKIFGILVGLAGVVLIALLPILRKEEQITGNFSGNLVIVVAVCTWAIYTIGSRYLITKKNYSPIMITGVSIVSSAIIFFFITILTSKTDYITPIFNLVNFILIIHLALFVTVATFLLFQWAIKHSSATTASLNNYLQPLFGVLLNIIILGEKITFGFIFGSILVLIGVFIVTGTHLITEVKNIIKLKRG